MLATICGSLECFAGAMDKGVVMLSLEEEIITSFQRMPSHVKAARQNIERLRLLNAFGASWPVHHCFFYVIFPF